MLTDRRRPVVALVCALGVVGCVVWWAWLHHLGTVGYGAFELHPERFDGQQVALSLVRVAAIEGPDGYAVEKGTLRLAVEGPSAGLELGEDVSVGGRWRASDQVLEQVWLERREAGRQAKRVLGVLGLLLAAGLAGGSIRWGSEGFELRG